MLQIKTFTARDKRGETGLFAAQDIPKGTVIWAYDPRWTRYIPAQDYLATRGAEREELAFYSYPIYDPEGEPAMVGVLLNMDQTRFTNHSDTPNTGTGENPAEEIALLDIREGEEITCDYREFDPEGKIHAMGIVTCKTFLMHDEAPKLRKC